VLVFFFTFLCTRILTKKAIAQMTAYEIAGVMILANVAAEPIVDKVLIKSVYGSGLLILIMLLITKLSTINKFTHILEHTPTVVINNGKIVMSNLKEMGISLNQLEGLLRQQGYDKVSSVHTAIIEPQGNLSIFPWSKHRSVQLKDMNIKVTEEGITFPIVVDGTIIKDKLEYIKKDKDWILKELKKNGVENVKEVALAEIDSSLKIEILRRFNE